MFKNNCTFIQPVFVPHFFEQFTVGHIAIWVSEGEGEGECK